MAKKKHFTGVGAEKIHTSREGECHQKKCNYRTNADSAPADPAPCTLSPRQAHHVLPVSCTIGYKSIDEFVGHVRAIDAVYKKTVWCVNKAPNMLWLPLKGTYSKRRRDAASRADPTAVWRMNLPCHDWDHNCADGFTDEVRDAFIARIWNPIKDAAKPEDCPDGEANATNLKKLEEDFRKELKKRGADREGGTHAAHQNEGKGTWWLPFSMAKTSVAKRRVVRAFGQAPEPPKSLVRSPRS